MTTLDFSDPTLREALQALNEGILIFDLDRRLLFVNDRARMITTIDLKEGDVLPEIFDKSRVVGVSPTESAQALPVMRAFKGERVENEELEVIEHDGSHTWLNVSASTLNDKDGRPKYVLCSFTDVSRRKHREHKLHFMIESAKILSLTQDFRARLEAKARLTVPSLADWCAVDLLKDDGSVERAVTVHRDPERLQFAETLLKRFPPDPNARRGVYHILRTGKAEFYPVVTQEMIDAALSQVPPERVEESRTVSEYLQLNSLMSIPIPSRGRTLGVMTLAYAESGRVYTHEDYEFFKEFCYHLGVLLDNSRLYQEISARDKAKDVFLASLSHELRNPLAPIKSSLELLRLEAIPGSAREELNIIEHQFDHMARLLHDLLDVSRFTQGKIEIMPEDVSLSEMIARSLKSTDALLKSRSITLHTSCPDQIHVQADTTRLEQAINNLISNAIKFTPPGGSIWVNVARENGRAVITVRDNGAGIDASDLPNIFDMYYQGEHTKTGINRGLGIGLLLVKQIINMHGGTVSAESAGRGAGSTFTIRLPLSETPVKSTPRSTTRSSSASGRRILIIDDNAQAADSLSRLLNKLGATSHAAYSGHEALTRNDLDKLDVILLDIGMPGMDGYETVKILRTRGISCPIIALTGFGLAGDKQHALDAGFTAHLTKPIGLTDLNTLFSSLPLRRE